MAKLRTKAQGVQIPPEAVPLPVDVIYANFEQGIDLSDAPEGIDPLRAVLALDVEAAPHDRLIRAPGISQVEDVSPRVLSYIFEHAGLDYATELVAIDPPFMGVKGIGNFAWYNLSLGATGAYGWTATNAIDQLLFSNGVDKTYLRDFGGVTVADLSASIVARALSTAFGRVFAGGVISGGGFQGLMIQWNDATGFPDDWGGRGSGAELLIADNAKADKIVAMRPIGFDYLGILCRHTLWIGQFTGNAFRPADFRQRHTGIGCVTRGSVATTVEGVAFLSDQGVAIFNENEAKIISEPINAALLPLDTTRLDKYVGTYLSHQARYILATPFETWIYDFEIPGRPARWWRRSSIVDSVINFTSQSGTLTWNDVVGSWDSQVNTWATMVQNQSDAAPKLYYTKGTLLGREEIGVMSYFGTPQAPLYRGPQASRKVLTDNFTTLGFEIQYASDAESTIRCTVPDLNGDFTLQGVKTLPSTDGKLVRRMAWINPVTGQGVGMQLEILAGAPEISHIRQIVQPTGPGLVTV